MDHNEHPSAGTLVTLSTGVYWYHEQRIDDLADRPLLLLDFSASPVRMDDTADGLTMGGGNRRGIATLLIDGVPRTVWIHGQTLTAVEV